ncbi:MAG TPA: hypothetical protein VEB18_02720 [Candidatus Paceibacterota bacterium]|nr:hypothetical protein [Candidatus Paceibacterota bacterium]
MNIQDFDPRPYVAALDTTGAVAIPSFLSLEDCAALLHELQRYEAAEAPYEVGPHKVVQQYRAVKHFPANSLFLQLRAEIQSLLARKFNTCLAVPLEFSDLVVQTYEAGSVGITPHRDGKSYINLVALVVLEGVARFCICEDRDGSNPVPISHEPGSLLLMRAPGFLGRDLQPMHFIDRITERRTTVGLRQRIRHL